MSRTSEYFIYAIVVDAPEGTLVKLGRASSVRQRLSEIQTGCPYSVRLVFACDVLEEYEGSMREAVMHDLYANSRMRGEWFSPWGRVASQEDLDGLFANMRDVAMERMTCSMRSLRMEPYIDAGGNRRMRTTMVDDVQGPVITDQDGYPMNAPYIVGNSSGSVHVMEKPKRRMFRRH